MNKLLSICYNFSPEITPTTIRIGKIMGYLQKDWQIQVVTHVENGYLGEAIVVEPVKSWYPKSLLEGIIKLRLGKFIEWFIPFWPEQAFFWIIPAVRKSLTLIKQNKPDIIVVFMMPYSVGWVGIILKWLTGLPLVVNFDDSPTCTDMGGNNFVSWFHYRATQWVENFYIRQADAVIYVSQRNLERIQKQQPEKHQSKFHLVRYGADPIDFSMAPASTDNNFEITYIGGMTGWFEFYHTPEEETLFKKLYKHWVNFGRYEVLKLDIRSSSPIFVGQAVNQVIEQYPEWKDKLKVKVYGNFYPDYVIERVLQNQNLTDIISAYPPVPNTKAIEIACRSDLLFLTLPARPSDAPPGGRISAKTYEYLMTDRPILAALSQGENWDYLEDKPGVWLVEPTDVLAMKSAIAEIAAAKLSGQPFIFDRSSIYPELSYATRSQEFHQVLKRIKP